MRFQCQHCQGVVAIDDGEAGQAAQCGHCGKIVVVPPTFCSPGAVIDDFVVGDELGKGGMGTVFLAHQMSLDRPAAIKILHPEFSQDSKFADELIREARAAAKLAHPNIVQAYAVGMEENIYFFAMEYVKGSTLKDVLAHSGRIVVERSLMIVHEMAKALEFAWENQRLVHRDIKPDNIILTDKGQVKLADLGLARPASDLLNEVDDEVMGTPQYISPEQLLGVAVDCRADIYCLGATLYHALTGRYPYTGSTPTEVAQKHLLAQLVPPAALVPDVSETVSTLVEVMMAKRPQHRYQTPAELVQDLERIRRGEEPLRGVFADSQVPIQLDLDDPMASPNPDEEQPLRAAEPTEDEVGLSHTSQRRLGMTREASASSTSLGSRASAGSTGKMLLQKSGGASSGGAGDTGKKKLSFDGSRSRGPGASTPGKTKLNMSRDHDAAASHNGSADSASASASALSSRSTMQPPRNKRKTGLLVAVVAVVVLLGGGGIAAVMLLGGGGPASPDPAPKQLAVQSPDPALPPLEKLRYELTGLIQKQPNTDAVLAKVVEYNRNHGKKFHMEPGIAAQLLAFDEEDIRAQRRQRRDDELVTWRQRARSLQMQTKFQNLCRTLVNELPVDKLRLENQLTADLNKIDDLQRQLRQDLVQRCQALDFSRARTDTEMARVRAESMQKTWENELGDTETSLQETCRTWARELQRAMPNLTEAELADKQAELDKIQRAQQQEYRSFFQDLRRRVQMRIPPYINWLNDKIAAIDLAEKCFALIHNSQTQYKGLKIDPSRSSVQGLPRGRHFKFKVDYIGRSDLDIGVYEDRLVNGNFVEARFKQISVPLQDLSLAQLVQLYESIWLRDHGDADRDELNLLMGSYLLVRADSLESLSEAKQRLLNSNRNDVVDPMLAELDLLRPQAWNACLDQLRRFVLEQETSTAERYKQYLKSKFPEEFPQYESKIKNILAGL